MSGIQDGFLPIEVGTMVVLQQLNSIKVIGMVVLQDINSGSCTIMSQSGMNKTSSASTTLDKKEEFASLPEAKRRGVYKCFNINTSNKEICKAVREATVTLR